MNDIFYMRPVNNQNKVEIGDVLDEINENVITGDSKGKLRKIMKKASGQPIMLHIIKVRIWRINHSRKRD